MKYRATEAFWESFYDLSPEQKESVRRAWQIFKADPFDPRLRAHKIHRLSAFYKRTIYPKNGDGMNHGLHGLHGLKNFRKLRSFCVFTHWVRGVSAARF